MDVTPIWPVDAIPRAARLRLAALRLARRIADPGWDEYKITNVAGKLGAFLAKAGTDYDLAVRAHALDIASDCPAAAGPDPADQVLRFAREFHRHVTDGQPQ